MKRKTLGRSFLGMARERLKPITLMLAGLGAFASCASEPKFMKMPLVEYQRTSKQEKVRQEIKLSEKYRFMLTDRYLVVVPRKQEVPDNGRMSLGLLWTKKDMRRILSHGLVAWTPADDRCFFLTKDGKIREIPVILHENTIPVYDIFRKVPEAKMTFHSSLLFIAPAKGPMIIMNISDEARYVELSIPNNEGDFFLRDKKLFFGNGKNEVEIKIKGEGLSDIEIVPR